MKLQVQTRTEGGKKPGGALGLVARSSVHNISAMLLKSEILGSRISGCSLDSSRTSPLRCCISLPLLRGSEPPNLGSTLLRWHDPRHRRALACPSLVVGLFTLVRRNSFFRQKYHTKPESISAAVIGRGWSAPNPFRRTPESPECVPC